MMTLPHLINVKGVMVGLYSGHVHERAAWLLSLRISGGHGILGIGRYILRRHGRPRHGVVRAQRRACQLARTGLDRGLVRILPAYQAGRSTVVKRRAFACLRP